MLRALAFLVQTAAVIFALAGAVVMFRYGWPALQQMFMGLQAEAPTVSVAGRSFSPAALVALCFGAALVLYFAARGLYRVGGGGSQ